MAVSGFGWVPRLLDRARGERVKRECPQIRQAREDVVPGFVKLNSAIQLGMIRGVQWLGSSFQER